MLAGNKRDQAVHRSPCLMLLKHVSILVGLFPYHASLAPDVRDDLLRLSCQLDRLVRVRVMMCRAIQVMSWTHMERAWQKWIPALHEQFCNAPEPEHCRQQQPDENDRLPWNKNHHRATSGEEGTTCALRVF